MNSQTVRAILWMIGGMASLLGISLVAKVLAPYYSTFEIMFYRSFAGFMVFGAFLAATGQLRSLNFGHYRLHLRRNLVHFTAQNLWFYALSVLPLAFVVTFEFTQPSWVIIIAAVILGEGFGWRRGVVIALSLIGIFVIMYPQLAQTTVAIPMNGVWAALACAIGFAVTMIVTKQLTRVQSVNEILLMMTIMQGIFAGLIITFLWDLAPITWKLLPWIILIGMLGSSSHYCITKALSLADATIVAPIDLIRLPASIVLGFLIFGESISMSLVFGAAILIGANYLNIMRKKV